MGECTFISVCICLPMYKPDCMALGGGEGRLASVGKLRNQPLTSTIDVHVVMSIKLEENSRQNKERII